MKDYYAILEIKSSATHDEIKDSFRKLARRWHPDREDGDETKFKEINEAHQHLSDPVKRRTYDVSLRPLPPTMPHSPKLSSMMDEIYEAVGRPEDFADYLFKPGSIDDNMGRGWDSEGGMGGRSARRPKMGFSFMCPRCGQENPDIACDACGFPEPRKE